MRERLPTFVFLTLVAFLPFEPARHVLGLSLLQWLFLILLIAVFPRMVRQRRDLLRDRALLAGGVFLVVCLLSALASEDLANAVRGVARIATGLCLFAVARLSWERFRILKVWSIAAALAAGYGILDYLGFGLGALFRAGDFFVGTVPRLSGSFEYPTTAAAYFAMSLPVVWWTTRRPVFRYGVVSLVWVCLVLTLSRGAAFAALGGLFAGGLIVGGSAANRVGGTWRSARAGVVVSALGVAIYLMLSTVEPLLWHRLVSGGEADTVGVDYAPRFNRLDLHPGSSYELAVRVTNRGSRTWSASGARRVVLTSYWYDVDANRILPMESDDSPLSVDVRPGEVADLVVHFEAPSRGGLYLLDLEMRQDGYGLFSNAGSYPGVVEVRVDSDATEDFRFGDVSRWYRQGPESVPSLDASVPRSALWRAAITMFRNHPVLGVGPDNYRLSYGAVLGYARWDERIRSNSLYLELASTVGFLGLSAFLGMLLLARYRWWPATCAVAVFLLHGLVDFFLMTTPIYFAFWIMLAFSNEDRV